LLMRPRCCAASCSGPGKAGAGKQDAVRVVVRRYAGFVAGVGPFCFPGHENDY
jgi:hypothetical protein